MSEIGFADDLVPLVASGAKTLTYRAGSCPWLPGDVARVRSAGFAILVTERRPAVFGELPLDDPRHEPYRSRDQMRNVFAGYYGRELPDDEPMTILGFRRD